VARRGARSRAACPRRTWAASASRFGQPDIITPPSRRQRRAGIFRSTDVGETWEKPAAATWRSDVLRRAVRRRRRNADRVYAIDVLNQVSEDGGRTWRPWARPTTRGQPRDLDQPVRHRPLARGLRRRPSTRAGTERRELGVQGEPCPSRSSTASRWTIVAGLLRLRRHAGQNSLGGPLARSTVGREEPPTGSSPGAATASTAASSPATPIIVYRDAAARVLGRYDRKSGRGDPDPAQEGKASRRCAGTGTARSS